RYPGAQFGERRTMRTPLGSYEQGLRELRLKRAACEQLITEGRSPKRYWKRRGGEQHAAGMTFREGKDENWPHALRQLWNPTTAKNNAQVRRVHLDNLSIMNMPLESIRAVHLEEAFGEKWRTLSSIGPHVRSLIHSAIQYQIDKDDGIFLG